MSDSKKRQEIAKRLSDTLKNSLKELGISLRKFADDFYYEKVDSAASSSELDDHFERFKTAIKRNSEVTALYLEHYKSKYASDLTVNKASKEAAYELYVELSTRVSTINLPDELGKDKGALDSVYSLFESWRSICRQHGSDAMFFLNHSITYFESSVRPFTSKWHQKLIESKTNSDFRCELLELQKATANYLKVLERDFGFEKKLANLS